MNNAPLLLPPQAQDAFFVISEWHAQGILLMKENRNREAISHFHYALQLLSIQTKRNLTQSFVLEDDHDTTATNHPNNGHSNNSNETPPWNRANPKRQRRQAPRHNEAPQKSPSTNWFASRILFSVAVAPPPSAAAAAAEEDILVPFRRALYSVPLSPLDRDAGSSWRWHRDNCVQCHLLSTIVLYNMGLALHIMGMDECKSRFLHDSLRFYAMAHATLTELLLLTQRQQPQPRKVMPGSSSSHHALHSPSPTPPPSSQYPQCTTTTTDETTLKLASLALINNMAHIHAVERNFVDAGTYCRELSFRFSSVLDSASSLLWSSSRRWSSTVLTPDEYNIFVSNVCFGPAMMTHTAAPVA